MRAEALGAIAYLSGKFKIATATQLTPRPTVTAAAGFDKKYFACPKKMSSPISVPGAKDTKRPISARGTTLLSTGGPPRKYFRRLWSLSHSTLIIFFLGPILKYNFFQPRPIGEKLTPTCSAGPSDPSDVVAMESDSKKCKKTHLIDRQILAGV